MKKTPLGENALLILMTHKTKHNTHKNPKNSFDSRWTFPILPLIVREETALSPPLRALPHCTREYYS